MCGTTELKYFGVSRFVYQRREPRERYCRRIDIYIIFQLMVIFIGHLSIYKRTKITPFRKY